MKVSQHLRYDFTDFLENLKQPLRPNASWSFRGRKRGRREDGEAGDRWPGAPRGHGAVGGRGTHRSEKRRGGLRGRCGGCRRGGGRRASDATSASELGAMGLNSLFQSLRQGEVKGACTRASLSGNSRRSITMTILCPIFLTYWAPVADTKTSKGGRCRYPHFTSWKQLKSLGLLAGLCLSHN